MSDELEFEWDAEKERINLKKHGVSFLTAAAIFDHATLQKVDDRQDYGEERLIALGQADLNVYRVAFTWRGENRIRIINAKRARKNEQEAYYREIHQERDPSDAGSR